jgi:hypothetical protein
MSSAEDVQNTNGILTLPRFQKCMGRVPSDEKIPGDMSDEGKCTVQGNVSRQTREAREHLTRKSDVNLVSIVHVSICSKRICSIQIE